MTDEDLVARSTLGPEFKLSPEEVRALPVFGLAVVLQELRALRAEVETSRQASTPRLLDRRGAAEYLRMSLATFDRRARRFLNAVETGGHPRYRVEDLERWAAMQSRRVPVRRPKLRAVGGR